MVMLHPYARSTIFLDLLFVRNLTMETIRNKCVPILLAVYPEMARLIRIQPMLRQELQAVRSYLDTVSLWLRQYSDRASPFSSVRPSEKFVDALMRPDGATLDRLF